MPNLSKAPVSTPNTNTKKDRKETEEKEEDKKEGEGKELSSLGLQVSPACVLDYRHFFTAPSINDHPMQTILKAFPVHVASVTLSVDIAAGAGVYLPCLVSALFFSAFLVLCFYKVPVACKCEQTSIFQ